MATLTIKNVPGPVLRRLKARAATHRRSLNLEVIACLEALVRPKPVDTDALLAGVRAIRQTPTRLRLTDRVLHRFKTTG
ncbi:MAG TPA: plasmid stability protein, partial [Methylomirabilota bacterium]|nr:plasmid stability protein [Methylomirabilota bacterium]